MFATFSLHGKDFAEHFENQNYWLNSIQYSMRNDFCTSSMFLISNLRIFQNFENLNIYEQFALCTQRRKLCTKAEKKQQISSTRRDEQNQSM
jgi:hypothetical protein